jgi:DNA-directed RNA polymerase subunit RPC12/RpoP
MNTPEENEPGCSKCGSDLSQDIEEGTSYCPHCGAGFENKLRSPSIPQKEEGRDIEDSKRTFWIILLIPAFTAFLIATLSMFGSDGRSVGMVLGIVVFFLNLVTSTYCGLWIGRRFFESDLAKVFGGIVFSVLLIVLNVAIVMTGCSVVFR